MEQLAQPFTPVGSGLAYGEPIPTGWQPMPSLPLFILVGVTGVGKSTTLAYLQQQRPLSLLPDRRDLTDRLIIGYLQAIDGEPIQPVTDRRARFAYTRRYHQLFAGGMSHALSQLLIDPTVYPNWLFFDGLRGEAEVAHAAQTLPNARFIVLDAPDWVRVQRLLGRSDRFDRISSTGTIGTTGPRDSLAAIGVADADSLFSPAEVQALLQLAAPPVGTGTVAVDELRGKLQIVVEERRSYDPQAAIRYLQQHASSRTLHLDTTQVAPDAVAQQILDWAS
ncbi:MAG: hypothetical protein KF832_00105 [Caldilineaceae bacterium]|nr:hypothetical protein [Caldilineaceae bacterium]